MIILMAHDNVGRVGVGEAGAGHRRGLPDPEQRLSLADGGSPGETAVDGDSAAKMSHQFRTPLNIIIGFAELMLDEVPGKINEEQRRSLTDILDSGRRLLDLLNDIMAR